MADVFLHRSLATSVLGGCLLWGLPAQALELSDAWVRAMPPGRPMTAAYLNLRNDSDRVVTVTGITSTLGEASLHETRVVDGRSTMHELPQLRLEPGAGARLVPGGMHIMLMGLTQTPVVGEVVPLCLDTDAGEFCVDAPVQRGGGSSQHHH